MFERVGRFQPGIARSARSRSTVDQMSAKEPKSFHQKRYTRPPTATDILLVRHGASAAVVEGQPFPMLAGQGNPELAPIGHEQAELVGARLARDSIDAIYVSSMVRTHQTAAPLVDLIGIEPIVEPDLREVYLGDWEAGVLRRRARGGSPYLSTDARRTTMGCHPQRRAVRSLQQAHGRGDRPSRRRSTATSLSSWYVMAVSSERSVPMRRGAAPLLSVAQTTRR